MQNLRTMPSLTAVRAFEAAARLGSFAKAGEELNMTGAAVSYQVKSIEQQLGLALFRRFPKRIELTEAGASVAPLITSAFSTIRAAFLATEEKFHGRLVISTLPTVGGVWLAPLLGDFRRRFPEIKTRLEMSVDAATFIDDEVDAAVRSGEGKWPGLKCHFLLPNIYTPVCAPTYADEVRAHLQKPEGSFPFNLLGRSTWWSRWYEGFGFPAVNLEGRFGVQYDVEQLYASAAAAGHGVAMISPIFFRRELESGTLVAPLDFAVNDGRAYWFAYPKSQAGREKIRHFRVWIEERAAEAREQCDTWIGRAVLVPAR